MNKIIRHYLYYICLLGPLISVQASEAASAGKEISLAGTLEELASESTGHYRGIIGGDEEVKFEVYLPKNFKTAQLSGLMVYISPTPRGRIPAHWRQVMDQQGLIWIAANIKLLVVPFMKHTLPDAKRFNRAIDYLDNEAT